MGKARAADRRAKLAAEPARWDGRRQCYICLNWFTYVDLEHKEDASVHPELRHVKKNHGWSCRKCNRDKKLDNTKV